VERVVVLNLTATLGVVVVLSLTVALFVVAMMNPMVTLTLGVLALVQTQW